MTLKIGNYNAYKLGLDARGSAAWNARVTAVRELAPDFLGLQEIVVDEDATPPAQWDAVAAQTITGFAEDCGLTATVPATPARPHGTAMAANTHRSWYTAVLWNPASGAHVPGSYRPLGAPDFWHGLTTAGFDIGAVEPLTVVSYHGHPGSPVWRTEEARRIKMILRRTGGVKPSIVVGDFNALSAARVPGPDGTLRYYDAEAYAAQRHDDLEYQVQDGSIGGEQLADRRQTEMLLRDGYMVDAAAHLGAPWQATVGHWPDGQGDPDPWGERRIDLILVSRPVAPALTAYGVMDSEAALAGSDHRIVWTTLAPAGIAATERGR
ncbi:endonuclease/exonuclease/phosphatase family metal-dependent hydrolase [Streptomyces sp. LBL]|uniref:endonuclease/exonuclease/phosphatase family protein n=1 Tax=Streptomyces sp. LBL TaxID=2940562 RepID=UPI0024755510|nr:endonuclease/exonuclease/phosphatase family protein [Streptomyces sp. LBL]MDH6624358.1 endonuclease/exonuclease/phosphatase family metal-dependent hydrolase [Streptomyces sp. LBL]